ncbi:hypothetical protein E2C01_088900 [Portunus trituberculatus]|uniref:Uncharacterized protein n=1 Tax=Portunus trituberculatus TaxID=210409 RepID=A0A5B7JFW3_PORTR|nr:hypothetical protein [Portunus trituberculatus]
MRGYGRQEQQRILVKPSDFTLWRSFEPIAPSPLPTKTEQNRLQEKSDIQTSLRHFLHTLIYLSISLCRRGAPLPRERLLGKSKIASSRCARWKALLLGLHSTHFKAREFSASICLPRVLPSLSLQELDPKAPQEREVKCPAISSILLLLRVFHLPNTVFLADAAVNGTPAPATAMPRQARSTQNGYG